jgi:hypothetical protein
MVCPPEKSGGHYPFKLKNKQRMKLRLFFTTFLLACCFCAFGQDEGENETSQLLSADESLEWFLNNNNAVDFNFSGTTDVLQINQVGDHNEMVAIQQLSDNQNYILTGNQEGTGNKGYINQTGFDHGSILSQKNSEGDLGNEANLWSVGNTTQNFVRQEGSENFVNSYVENTTGFIRRAISIQKGNNNRIDLALIEREEENNLMGVRVTQTGNANSANMILKNYDAPFIKVHQTGGAKIEITHSDFYFPGK